MTQLILKDANVTINSVDLSDHVKEVTVNYEAETQDDTVMGDNTRSMAGGLKNWSIDVNFVQDFAASEVDQTLFTLVGSTTTVSVYPDNSAAVSGTNPQFSGTGLLTTYPPLGNAVGDLAETSVTFVAAGDLSRNTST